MSEENSKKVGEFCEYIDKIDLAEVEYEAKIKACAKRLVDDLHRVGRENVVNHVQAANSLISRKKDVLCPDDMFIKKHSMALEYFLILSIDKYGIGSVLEKLLPCCIIHKKHSKLNPINWLLWLFNKIVWSEVKVSSEFSDDKPFRDAIQNLKKMSETADSFARKDFADKDLHEAVNIVIERIANGAAKEEVAQKVTDLIDFHDATAPEEKQQQKNLDCSDKSSQNEKDLAGLTFPKSSKSNTEQELAPPSPFSFLDNFQPESLKDDDMPLPPPPAPSSPLPEDITLISFPPAPPPFSFSDNFFQPKSLKDDAMPPPASSPDPDPKALMASIRKGRRLKKADPEANSHFKDKIPLEGDIGDILRRRPAVAFSDSESDSEYSDFEDQDWGNDSEERKQNRGPAAYEKSSFFRKTSPRMSSGDGDIPTDSVAPLHG